jgi:hypothetical protein
MTEQEIIGMVFEYLDCTEEEPSWEAFHEQYPDIEQWEYELGCKRYQEM